MRCPHIFPQEMFFCGLLLTLVIHFVFSCSVPLNCSLLDVTTGLPLCYFPFFVLCFLRFIVPGAADALINQDPFLGSVPNLFCRFIFIFIGRPSLSSFWVVFQFFSFGIFVFFFLFLCSFLFCLFFLLFFLCCLVFWGFAW